MRSYYIVRLTAASPSGEGTYLPDGRWVYKTCTVIMVKSLGISPIVKLLKLPCSAVKGEADQDFETDY